MVGLNGNITTSAPNWGWGLRLSLAIESNFIFWIFQTVLKHVKYLCPFLTLLSLAIESNISFEDSKSSLRIFRQTYIQTDKQTSS